MSPMSRLVTTLATRQLARTLGGVGAGPLGAAVGIALPMVVRTMGPAGMVGLALGGWLVRRALDKRAAAVPRPSKP